MQRGCTALWLACKNKHEAAAAELMEATKLAGALDLQVAQADTQRLESVLRLESMQETSPPRSVTAAVALLHAAAEMARVWWEQ